MKDIKVEYNHHLHSELQVRFSRIVEMLYWCPGGVSSEAEAQEEKSAKGAMLSTAKPNLANPNFIVTFLGRQSRFIGFVDKDYLWGTGGPDQFKQIVPVIGADVTVGNPYNRNYSSGLAVLNYGDTIGIVKNEDVGADGADGIRIVVYDQSSGQHIETLAVCDNISYVYSQAVNISPDGLELWFSWTNDNCDDCWMKCTRTSTSEVFGPPVEQFKMLAAWKVLWDDCGEIWFAGKETDYDGQACIYRTTNLEKIVSIDSYSAGFAFDDFGNLWVGTYTDSGPATQQYLLMYKHETVERAINLLYVLTQSDADVTYDMPTLERDGVSYFTGVSDIAYADGYMYITANGGFNEEENTEVDCILRIPTHAGTEDDPFAAQEDLKNIYTAPPSDDWNWLKAIGIGMK